MRAKRRLARYVCYDARKVKAKVAAGGFRRPGTILLVNIYGVGSAPSENAGLLATGSRDDMATALQHAAFPAEDRRFQSVTINLPGRLMCADYSEHDCVAITMSPGEAEFRCSARVRANERIVAYLDHVGRVEGLVAEARHGCFSVTLNATARKREKLAAQLTWLANKHELALPEDRRHERHAPRNPRSEVHLDDGRRYPCRIIDLSLSGAAMEIEVRPALGTAVTLGTMRGRVVRHFQEGIAMEFVRVQPVAAMRALIN